MTTKIKIRDSMNVSSIFDSENVTVPDSRIFREAWQLEGEVITVDMVKARNIQRDRIRIDRDEWFELLDANFMKALETGADITEIVTEKQLLRDAPDDTRIEAATTPDELEILTLAYLMANPL